MVRPGEKPDQTTVFMYVNNDGDERLREATKKGTDAQKEIMTEYFQDAGWESSRIIKQMNAADDFYYDMIAQVKMQKWSKGRVVLLGDAAYCASPISGMGTTLGLTGAYNLAGALTQHPNDPEAAFSQYEQAVRPTVEKAQKQPPGKMTMMAPETASGIWFLYMFMSFIMWTRLPTLIIKYAGPPANDVPVEDFGFRELEDWKDYQK